MSKNDIKKGVRVISLRNSQMVGTVAYTMGAVTVVRFDSGVSGQYWPEEIALYYDRPQPRPNYQFHVGDIVITEGGQVGQVYRSDKPGVNPIVSMGPRRELESFPVELLSLYYCYPEDVRPAIRQNIVDGLKRSYTYRAVVGRYQWIAHFDNLSVFTLPTQTSYRLARKYADRHYLSTALEEKNYTDLDELVNRMAELADLCDWERVSVSYKKEVKDHDEQD